MKEEKRGTGNPGGDGNPTYAQTTLGYSRIKWPPPMGAAIAFLNQASAVLTAS
jgi:hypothetical protein